MMTLQELERRLFNLELDLAIEIQNRRELDDRLTNILITTDALLDSLHIELKALEARVK